MKAKQLTPIFVLAAIALAITLPVALQPPRAFQSFWVNTVWLEQFSNQLAHGNLYPRWLPESHNGLGSPVFFYYPPLAFFISAIPDLLGLNPYHATLAGFTFGSFASGVTMYWWLQNKPNRLFCSALFMLMPYHVFDFWFRGALAEHMAIAFIPLLAIGLKRNPAILALSYAGIIVTHLPLALLVSLFLIIPYGLWLIYNDFSHLKRFALALTGGLLLSAVYLYPALALDEFRKTDELYRLAMFKATAWNFFAPEFWPAPMTMARIIFFTFLIALGALSLLKKKFWIFLSLSICVLVSGAIPIWDIPLLAMVQFPWRSLPIAEFALVTALASAPLLRAAIGGLPPLVGVALSPAHPMAHAGGLDTYTATHVDVAEYLPPSAPGGIVNYSDWAQKVSREHPGKTFYFPSLGESDDGLFLRGNPDEKRLPAEWIGLIISLLGACLTAVIGIIQFRHREG